MIAKTAAILVGSLLISLGVNVFILPAHLLEGGVIGLSLIIKYVWGIKVGLTIICFSIPIYLLALKIERSYFFNGVIGMMVSSFIIDLMEPVRGILQLPIVQSALFGGLFVGTGIGLMLRYDTCVGGMDLLALFLSRWLSVNVGIFILILDSLVILFGIIVLGGGIVFYSLITILAVGFATMTMTLIQSVKFYEI